MIDIFKFIIDTLIGYIKIFFDIPITENVTLGFLLITIIVMIFIFKLLFLRWKGD